MEILRVGLTGHVDGVLLALGRLRYGAVVDILPNACRTVAKYASKPSVVICGLCCSRPRRSSNSRAAMSTVRSSTCHETIRRVSAQMAVYVQMSPAPGGGIFAVRTFRCFV